MAVIGYARISTVDQDPALQSDALGRAGCDRIIEERKSGADRRRPALNAMLASLKSGDVVVAWKLDRVARSMPHLLQVIERIEVSGASFRLLSPSIDTSTPVGRLNLHVLGAVAEFERSLIIERTVAGLQASAERGRVGGNRKLKARDPVAIAQAARIRRDRFEKDVLARIDSWRPIVVKMRPGTSWDAILKKVNAGKPEAQRFTRASLLRHVRKAAMDNLVDKTVLDRAPPGGRPAGEEPGPALRVAMTALRRRPDSTLSDIAAELFAADVPARRGGRSWSLSSVANLRQRAAVEISARDQT